jgi:hypothetical protein
LLTLFGEAKKVSGRAARKRKVQQLRKCIKNMGFFKNCLTLNLPINYRIKFGNDGFAFQVALDKWVRNFKFFKYTGCF